MGTLRPADIQRYEIRRNVGNAHWRAHAAHDAVHEHFRNALEVSKDRLPDTFTHVDLLWTGFGACIAIPAERCFRIEIEEILLRVLELLDVVDRFTGWKRWHQGKGHAVLHRRLTGETGSDLRIVLRPIVRRTGTTEATEAADASDHFLAGVPHGPDDRNAFRDFILLPGDLNSHQPG